MQIDGHAMVTTASRNRLNINGLAISCNRSREAGCEKCPLLGNVYHVEAILVSTNAASLANV